MCVVCVVLCSVCVRVCVNTLTSACSLGPVVQKKKMRSKIDALRDLRLLAPEEMFELVLKTQTLISASSEMNACGGEHCAFYPGYNASQHRYISLSPSSSEAPQSQ